MHEALEFGSVTQEKAAKLLERAATLDAEGGSRVAIEELRQAALEAGISPESFERALAELSAHRSDEVTPPAPVASSPGGVVEGGAGAKLSAIIRGGGIVATGAVLGMLSQVLITDLGMHDIPAIIFTLVITMFIAVWFAVTRRRDREVLGFEMDLGALWAGLTFWLMVSDPADAGETLGLMLTVGAAASVVGGLIAATGPTADQPEQLPEST